MVGCFGEKVPVFGENDGEIGEVMVEEVVVVVELAVGEVELEMYQRGLPYDGMARSISFWRPLLHYLSSLGLSKFPWVCLWVLLGASF